MALRGAGFKMLGLWWLVALVVAGGLATMAWYDVRLGGRIAAGGLLLGALVRLVRRPRKAGGLRVRGRFLDVLILLGLGAAVLVASATVKLT